MNEINTPAEELIRPLLERLDRTGQRDLPAEHPDEETLALFAHGSLDKPARTTVTEHLARCVDCRKAVSLLLTIDNSGYLPAPLPPQRRLSRRTVILSFASAAAAVLLVSIIALPQIRTGLYIARANAVHRQAAQLLAATQYDEARNLIAKAHADGLRSADLTNLESQAERRIPGEVALASRGRLSDFGYEIDGVVARAPAESPGRAAAKRAEKLLSELDDKNVALVLNRGHALLALDEPKKALAEFQKVIATAPQNAFAYLGQGIAHYMLDDYAAAEGDFHECLRLDPSNLAAKINLAMAFNEQDKGDKSLPLWKSLLGEPLTPDERQKIEQEIARLERRPH